MRWTDSPSCAPYHSLTAAGRRRRCCRVVAWRSAQDFQAVTPLESNFLHQRIVKTPLEAYSGDLGGAEHCLEETSTFYRIPPGVTWRDLRRSAPCPP